MKKIMVILVGVFTLAAILLVSFFGTLPYTKEANIYCDYITMNMPEAVHDEGGNEVYITEARPEDETIKPGDEWFDNNYAYRIKISKIDYILDKGAKLDLHCKAMTNKTGKAVTDEKLNYYCIEPSESEIYEKYLTIKEDTITFVNDKTLYTIDTMTAFTFKVQSNDAHKKFINIRMQIKGIVATEANV